MDVVIPQWSWVVQLRLTPTREICDSLGLLVSGFLSRVSSSPRRPAPSQPSFIPRLTGDVVVTGLWETGGRWLSLSEGTRGIGIQERERYYWVSTLKDNTCQAAA